MRKYCIVSLILLLLMGCSVIQDGTSIDTKFPDKFGSSGIIEDLGISTTDSNELNKNIEIFFSDPINITGGSYDYGPEKFLVKAIKSALISVDIAIYNFNLWDLRDALLESYERGVNIRIVIESENISDEVVQQLREAGIQVIGDRRESLMHNKFVIVDRIDVWTGSMNFTVGSAYYDNNNLIHIHSPEVAENYLTEFDEMFILDMFGDNIMPLTPNPLVIIDDSEVEVYFSPDDNVADHIIELLNQARESIVFMAYSFTSDMISSAMIEKFQNGITVSGIMDSGQASGNQGTEINNLLNAGIEVYLDKSPGLMHHKVIVVDHQVVISGSYNFSRNAEISNDENIVIFHNSSIAELYLMEYAKLLSLIQNK